MTGITIDGKIFIPQLETDHIIKAPMTTNGRLSLRANAVLLQNAGNCNVILSSGFTLTPGQPYMFGNYNELTVQRFDVQVQFDTATATGDPVVQRLEIVQVLANFKGSGFYIDQKTINLQKLG